MREKRQKRFAVKYEQSVVLGVSVVVVVDTETGVNYLVLLGSAPSVTPLLDRNGNVVIDSVLPEE